MTVSASRRTDIPALYGEWFMRRIRAGFALARNPFRPSAIRRVDLDPEGVESIVFWTKDPSLFLPRLGELGERGFRFWFQYTLTPYGPALEPGLPEVERRIGTFLELSSRIGAVRTVWRYDPVLLSDRFDQAFHEDAFGRISSALAGAADTCVLSFLDPYRRLRARLSRAGVRVPDPGGILSLAATFARSAAVAGMRLATCCESADLSAFGVLPGACIDPGRTALVSGRAPAGAPTGAPGRDRGQRPGCMCSPSVDIGAYDTCTHGCVYCYATGSTAGAAANRSRHDPDSPLLVGPSPAAGP